MKVFPTNNERTITNAILMVSIGLLLGLIVRINNIELNDLFSPIATLIAAFSGAWFAYKLQNNKKKLEEVNSQVDTANDLLFSLYQKINALGKIKKHYIDPHNSDTQPYIAIEPIIRFELPGSRLRSEDVTFLFKTKYKQLPYDLHIEEWKIYTAELAIKFRSELYYEYIQPAFYKAKLIEGEEYTDEEYKSALGELLYKRLKNATKLMKLHVGKTIPSSKQVYQCLIKALKETFPAHHITEYKFSDAIPSKTNHNDIQKSTNID